MSKSASNLPFIWPDLFNTPLPGQALQSPLDPLATPTTRGLFGAISNADTRAAHWLSTWLSQNSARKLRLVISIHPTCRTTSADLEALLHLCDVYGDRAAFRLYPEGTLSDRASNLLCYYSPDGQASLSLGPSHNLGFDDRSPSRGNLATAIGLDTLNECRKWFDYLWGCSAPLDSLAAPLEERPTTGPWWPVLVTAAHRRAFLFEPYPGSSVACTDRSNSLALPA